MTPKKHDPKTVGQRLKHLRIGGGLSMRELASRANVAASFVSKVEAGKASPTIMTLQKLLEAMGLEVADFFLTADGPDPADQVVFKRRDMYALEEVDRQWVYAFPRHPDIEVVMTYEEYQPQTEILEVERHPKDTYGQVISGQLTIEIPGRGTFTAGRGDAFYLQANTEHTARNAGKSVLKMVVVQPK